MNDLASAPNQSVNPYRDIYEQFAADASFLWLLRSIAVNQPHYNAVDLAELDQRIQAHLSGLMTWLDESWNICAEMLSSGDPGETFTAAILAFSSQDAVKIQQVVEAGLASPEAFTGLTSALGWLPGRECHSWIKKFFLSKDLNHKYLAVAACSVRREDPRDYLTKIFQREDCLAHEQLYARALRLVGELKRSDLMPGLRVAMRAESASVKFWALWSAILLGDKTAVNDLKSFVLDEGDYQLPAIELAFRVLPIEEARTWIGLLAKVPEQARQAIKATAVFGDPQAVNWLIAQMRVPQLARLAGEAFSCITGIDLEQHKLVMDAPPEVEQAAPNDDPTDDAVAMDDDERLAFPDASAVAVWWQEQQVNFIPAQRYLLGGLVSEDHLERTYVFANQRQCRAVALELALLQPAQFLRNCAASHCAAKGTLE